jgi:hypothetical protein
VYNIYQDARSIETKEGVRQMLFIAWRTMVILLILGGMVAYLCVALAVCILFELSLFWALLPSLLLLVLLKRRQESDSKKETALQG